MKVFTVFVSAALAAVAHAQFQGLPSCATTCATALLGGGSVGNCGTDAKCICSNNSFLEDIACCVSKPGACSGDDIQKSLTFAKQICNANGVQVPAEVVCKATNTTVVNGTGTANSPSTTPSGGLAPATAAPVAAVGLAGLFAAMALF